MNERPRDSEAVAAPPHTGDDAALASDPFDALPDDPIPPESARLKCGDQGAAAMHVMAIAEVSTTVDPGSAHDSVTSVTRPDEAHHQWFQQVHDDPDDAT